ncbi:MAG: cell division protein FtsZ, partial [bacterium]|nr:cell division protein FtsZ [bacterium]
MVIELANDNEYGQPEGRETHHESRRHSMIDFNEDGSHDMMNNSGPKITVVGVGGGGSNAVDSMGDGSLDGVEFIVVNTDIQALQRAKTPRKIHIGKSITKGLGTGANPVLGEQAANEDRDLIRAELEGADLVFVTAGLGGGTGTGASSVIADVVKELGALSVAITTKPFEFEGTVRRNHAEKGQQILRKKVDTLITIPNQRLISVVDESTTLIDAFKVADSVLKQCVQSISDLITRPGLINLDFADIKSIMDTAGGAVMGVGYGRGANRAEDAFKQASCSPLMEEQVIEGAKGILINITCGSDIKLLEIDKAITTHIRNKADGDANVIFGVVIDP